MTVRAPASTMSALAGAATTVAVLLAAVLSAGATGTDQTVGDFIGWTWLGLAGGGALVATLWLVRADHPVASVGLSMVSLAWVLPRLVTWTSLPPRAQVALLAAPPLAVAGAALLAAGWARTTGTSRLVRITAALATSAWVVQLLGYNPFDDPGCQSQCAQSPPPLAHVISTHATLAAAGMLTLGAGVAAACAVVSNPGPAVVRAGAALAAALVTAAALDQWSSWGNGLPPSVDRLQTLGTAAAALTAAVALAHARLVQLRVRRVVDQLAAPGLLGRTGGVARDLHFVVPTDGRRVDAAGHVIASGPCQQCVVLSTRDGPSVHLVLHRWEQPHHLLAAVTPAARLALENARLHAVELVRLSDLRASQRRIVEVADSERRRIERDLHDGAQQRLVAVTMHLASASTRSDRPVPHALQAAEAHVRAALTGLRELSHDSLGAGLVTEGLVVAVEELVATSSVRPTLRTEIDEDHYSPAVQMTAYLVIAEGWRNLVAYSGCSEAQVSLREDGDGLIVEVLDEGRGGAVMGRGLTEIADRVGALSGQVTLDSPVGAGTRLTVRLPCVS